MVADLYDKLGFERIDQTEGGDRYYRLDVESFAAERLPHAIEQA